jgi:hypothetical protein
VGIPCFRHKDLRDKEEIGSGGFGWVVRAAYSKNMVVVKILHEMISYLAGSN